MSIMRNHHAFKLTCSSLLLFLTALITLSKYQVIESVPVVNYLKPQAREPITLEEAFLGELRAREFDSDWLSGGAESSDHDVGDQLVYEDSKNIVLVTLPPIERRNSSSVTGSSTKSQSPLSSLQANITILVSNTSLVASIEFQGYKISPSKRYLLLWNSRRKQYRHSSTAKYFLYDIKLDLITLLSSRTNASQGDPSATSGTDDDPSRFQLVEWYSKKTADRLVDSLILIQNNDIYNLFDVSRLANSYDAKISNATNTYESPPAPLRLTKTGEIGVVFNGVPDWLYEEEILSDSPAFQVSPLADHLAYISFDDSQVNIMPLTIYGDRVIPHVQQIRYPKTGQPNPRVSVHIVQGISASSETGAAPENIRLELPDDLAREQHYINRINWLTNDKLGIIWSNRHQNQVFVVICSKLGDVSAWKCEKNLEVKTANGWLDISDDILPLDSNHYLALIPKYEGPDVGEFKHIARVSLTSSNSFVFLTSGLREVIMFNGIDYKRSLVYYTSTVLNQPGQRQLFVAELESTSKEQLDSNPTGPGGFERLGSSSVCVTCDHHPDNCLYNYARMSPSTNYYVFQCAGPDIPRTELRATRRRRHRNFQDHMVDDTRQRKFLNESEPGETNDDSASNGQSSLVWTLEDNEALRDKLENHRLLPVTVRMRVPIPETSYLADVLLLLPPLENPSENDNQTRMAPMTLERYASLLPSGQQFPMVVDVYGGPGSQKVDYRYSASFGHYMASNKQTVYAMIDGRGSGYQGTKRLHELYHRLGTVEIQDQIDVTDHLGRTLPFIDSTRVAIWGWSYGGYAAAMSLARSKLRAHQLISEQIGAAKRDPFGLSVANLTSDVSVKLPHSVFKCAASVAPVTNWIYYDTAYTEKYMSSPWLNEHYDEYVAGDHLMAHNQSEPRDITSTRNSQFPTNKWTPLNETLIRPPRHTRPQELVARPYQVNTSVPLVSQVVGKPLSTRNVGQNDDLNERYKKASLLDQMIHVDSKNFLLMHGTADDNVNFQQSIMLMKRLIKKNILFETRLFPDQDHGIANKADKLHLGSTLSDFLSECFSQS